MLTQLVKFGALIATGRFLKPRWKGVLWVLFTWLVLWIVHGEYVSYVQLSGDTRFVLHASLLKLALYALSVGIYVWRVERPLWPKRASPAVKAVTEHPAAESSPKAATALSPGDDGFDFLRRKGKLKNEAEQLLGKK